MTHGAQVMQDSIVEPVSWLYYSQFAIYAVLSVTGRHK